MWDEFVTNWSFSVFPENAKSDSIKAKLQEFLQ